MLRPTNCYKLALLADRLLLRCHRAAPRTLAGARVGVRALAAHRKIPAVANAAIGLNFNQPADIHLDLLAEIAFHAAFLLDGLANVVDFLFGQVADFFRVVHAGFRGQLFRALPPDAVDGGQANPQPLLNRKINACYACHETCLLKILLESDLSLALLVLRVGANHAHHAAPVNHLALVANLLYRCPYFHFASLFPASATRAYRKLASLVLGRAKARPYNGVLLVAVDDAAARQIVRRKLHGYFVSRENTNKIFAHLAGNVRQHSMLVFQFHAKHGVGQRLDHRGHHFDGVLLGIAGVAFLFFVAKLLRHSLLFSSSHHDGPVTSFGRVKIQGPFAVTATVCSKCAEGLPSAVSATHSSRMRTSARPAFTIGSTAITMPSCSRAPRPTSP